MVDVPVIETSVRTPVSLWSPFVGLMNKWIQVKYNAIICSPSSICHFIYWGLNYNKIKSSTDIIDITVILLNLHICHQRFCMCEVKGLWVYPEIKTKYPKYKSCHIVHLEPESAQQRLKKGAMVILIHSDALNQSWDSLSCQSQHPTSSYSINTWININLKRTMNHL